MKRLHRRAASELMDVPKMQGNLSLRKWSKLSGTSTGTAFCSLRSRLFKKIKVISIFQERKHVTSRRSSIGFREAAGTPEKEIDTQVSEVNHNNWKEIERKKNRREKVTNAKISAKW